MGQVGFFFIYQNFGQWQPGGNNARQVQLKELTAWFASSQFGRTAIVELLTDTSIWYQTTNLEEVSQLLRSEFAQMYLGKKRELRRCWTSIAGVLWVPSILIIDGIHLKSWSPWSPDFPNCFLNFPETIKFALFGANPIISLLKSYIKTQLYFLL